MIDQLMHLALIMGKMGLLSFGGSTTVLAELEHEMVAQGWITHTQFVEAYAMGLLVPGGVCLCVIPMGYRALGIAGAVVSLIAYYTPTMSIALLSARVWQYFRTSPWCVSFRVGMVPVALGLILSSVFVLGRAMVTSVTSFLIIATTTILLTRTKLNTLWVLSIAILAGIAFLRP